LAILIAVVLLISTDGFYQHVDLELLRSSPCFSNDSINSSTAVPADFDWRSSRGRSFLTPVANQFLPLYCGSCWAFSAAGVLSDRLNILRLNSGVTSPIVLSPQPLLDCCSECSEEGQGCKGGNDFVAYGFVHKHGLTDVTCSSYTASQGYCDSSSFCKACYYDGTCRPVRNATRYYVDECGVFAAKDPSGQYEPPRNVEAMKREIMQRGSISCAMYHWVEAFTCYQSGVIDRAMPSNVSENATTHVVMLIGWGRDEDGQAYWVAKNSMGVHWGEEGFRIAQGKNTLNIERYCRWATISWPAAPLQKHCMDNYTSHNAPPSDLNQSATNHARQVPNRIAPSTPQP